MAPLNHVCFFFEVDFGFGCLATAVYYFLLTITIPLYATLSLSTDTLSLNRTDHH